MAAQVALVALRERQVEEVQLAWERRAVVAAMAAFGTTTIPTEEEEHQAGMVRLGTPVS
ncbi:hypothetical protein [Bradyrhizobium yuanmingense]|uniref:hypothetical protein n=1 Tax=Bradyrhizobium yuanmingense TaxID=108015 RepID=UPI0035124BC8